MPASTYTSDLSTDTHTQYTKEYQAKVKRFVLGFFKLVHIVDLLRRHTNYEVAHGIV